MVKERDSAIALQSKMLQSSKPQRRPNECTKLISIILSASPPNPVYLLYMLMYIDLACLPHHR